MPRPERAAAEGAVEPKFKFAAFCVELASKMAASLHRFGVTLLRSAPILRQIAALCIDSASKSSVLP